MLIIKNSYCYEEKNESTPIQIASNHKNHTFMKRIIIFILLAFSSLSVNAQLVEHFENPQRFQFTPYEHDNSPVLASFILYGPLNWDDYRCANDSIFYSRICIRDNSHDLIYGIAVPLQFFNYLNPYGNIDTNEYLNKVLTYYDTSNTSAFIGVTTNRTGYDYGLLSRTSLRIGESALIGNYFKMPDEDSTYYLSGVGQYLQVLEVYFEQPVSVNENFVVGLNISHAFSYGEKVVPLTICKGNGMQNICFPGSDTTFYSKIVDSSFINVSWPDGFEYLDLYTYNTWGAPFPIVTPPPCMPPIWLKVAEQHRQGATIEWRAQYANTSFEVEYGPRGFAEGTGTTVGPITPDAQYNGHLTLNNLTMDQDYTVRVRSYCNITGGYSDWTELDFHTDAICIVSTLTNNDEWGFVVGGGDYLSGTTVQLFAYPRSESHPFLNWSDGSNQNPRTFTVTRDTSFTAFFGNTEGLENAAQLLISVCPNPASSDVVVRSDSPIASWTLYNIQGRVIASDRPGTASATIDLRQLQPALYILSVRTEQGTINNKIIKK